MGRWEANRYRMLYVPRTPQSRPSPVNAASQTKNKATNTSTRNSDAELKEENGIPHAIVPTGTSEEKQLAADPLGDAGSKMQQEVGKEFSALMASGTVRATEAATLATNKVLLYEYWKSTEYMPSTTHEIYVSAIRYAQVKNAPLHASQPPSAATYCCRRKRGCHRESPPETRLMSETAATISTVVPKRYSRRRPNLFLFVLENTAVAAVQESAE
ncbi:hypothetical protein Tco_1525021 [Tanacetum coccineum]